MLEQMMQILNTMEEDGNVKAIQKKLDSVNKKIVKLGGR